VNPSPEHAQAGIVPPGTSITSHIRGSSLFLVGRHLSLLLNLGVQVLIVRYLTKADYGAFAYALAIMAPGSTFAAFGLERTIGRFLPIYQEQGDYARVLGTIVLALGTALGLGTLVVLLVVVSQTMAHHVVADPVALSLLFSLIALCPAQALDGLFTALFAVFASPGAIFFRRYVLAPLLRLVAVLLLVALRADVHFLALGYLAGGLLGTAVSSVLLLRVLHKQGWLQRFRRHGATLPYKDIFGFSVPSLSSDLVGGLRNALPVLLLGLLHSSAAVAALRAVQPVARLNLLVWESFRLLFTPVAARFFARDDRDSINELYWHTASWMAVLSFPIFAITFSLAKPLTVLLFGEPYADSGVLLALLSVGLFVQTAFGFVAPTLRVFGHVRYIVAVDTLAAILTLVLNLLLVPWYGAIGAAVTSCVTLVSQILLYQRGLVRIGGLVTSPGQYVQVYVTILVAFVSLLGIQALVAPPFYAAVALVVAAFIAILGVNRELLNIRATFPEAHRFISARQLFGFQQR
jgi:O-antigen/teichoic acid export membrane protein